MDLTSLKLFKMALTRLDWAAQRQKVLSQNISNADPPHYRPKDLKPLEFKQILKGQLVASAPVARTDPAHLKGTIPEQDHFRSLGIRKTFEESPDGNQVVAEEQMQKVGDTRSSYDTAVTIMQSQMKMLNLPLKGGGGS
ncbi:MAG: flagellar basal body rod protein FlgB [Rhodospirillaceae bacterium]|nr:flagellar basal body rod protein FlgB [Rhodospirillaceae bacterium]